MVRRGPRVYRPVDNDRLAEVDSESLMARLLAAEVLTWPQRVGTIKSRVELQY